MHINKAIEIAIIAMDGLRPYSIEELDEAIELLESLKIVEKQ